MLNYIRHVVAVDQAHKAELEAMGVAQPSWLAVVAGTAAFFFLVVAAAAMLPGAA